MQQIPGIVNDQQFKAPEVVKPVNNADLINAFKQKFATSVKRIYINSLQKEVGFREITVLEQKQLSRIMVDNEQRKDIIYDAQCALINQISLDDQFDIYTCSEFDKIKLLIAIYQNNMFKSDMTFKCEDCGKETTFRLDFQNVLDKMAQFDISDKIYNFENENWKFDFTISYPTVRKISNFYKSFANKYKKMTYSEIESMNNMINVDYITMYIKSIHVISKIDNSDMTMNMENFSISEIQDSISILPQDVMYSDNGILNFITNNFIKSINDQFEKHKCPNCGSTNTTSIDQDVSSFL